MQTSTLKYREFYSTLLWLSVSAISYYLVYLKFLALDFHTRDYAFYTEFIIKWSRPVSEQQYSMNPGGYNFLGISSTDGCYGFYQWIHFEPIRFIQAFIYKISHSLQTVFIFNSLVVCSPILAITKWLSKTSTRLSEYFIWVLLFVVFPATLLVSGYDNRPSMFLGVGYFWLLYSLLATKKIWLQFLFFIFLFSIREESLILNAFVLVYLFFQWRKKDISGKWLISFTTTWVVYLVGLLVYFNYWNYDYFNDTASKYSMFILLIAAGMVILINIFLLFKKKYHWLLFLPIIIYVVQLWIMQMRHIFPDEKYAFYNDPRVLTIFLIGLSWMLYNRSLSKKIFFYFVCFLIPLFIGFNFFGDMGLISRINRYKVQKSKYEVLLTTIKKIQNDPIILTDYGTHQALIENKNLYCVDRLPCHMDKSSNRFYPDNFNLVRGLINRGTWMIMSKDNLEHYRYWLDAYGSYAFETNSDYTIVKIREH